MSNTITIKDPNGNIVCSVENVDATRSEEKMAVYASWLNIRTKLNIFLLINLNKS